MEPLFQNLDKIKAYIVKKLIYNAHDDACYDNH